jgi:hypothetical protein
MHTLTALGVSTQVFKAVHWTYHDTRGPVASKPLNRDLHPFAFACRRHHHWLDDLTHKLFPVSHGRRGRLPKGWNGVSELFDRFTLGRREHVGLGVQKTLVIFLELAMCREPLFPVLGSLPGHQAVFRLNQAVVPGGSLGLIGSPRHALLPQLVHLLAFLLQTRGRFQGQGERCRFKSFEDPLTDGGLERLARQRPAQLITIVGCQTVTHLAMRVGGASIANLHAMATPSTYDQACQKRRPIAHRAQCIGMRSVGLETGHIAFVWLPGDRSRMMIVYQHVVVLT